MTRKPTSQVFLAPRVTCYCRNRALVSGSNARRESLDRKRNAPKMAILTKKSKTLIKAKVIFMKSCLQGHVGFMIRYILNNLIFSTVICKKGLVLFLFVFNWGRSPSEFSACSERGSFTNPQGPCHLLMRC